MSFQIYGRNNVFTSTDAVAHPANGAPHIAGTAVAFPPNRYNQEDVARELTSFADQGFMRFARTTGVDHRSLALPLWRYPKLTGFTEANTAYIEVAVDIGERAVLSALDAAGIAPDEVDIIVTVSSTGVAVPTIDARLAPAIGLRPDVKRVPLFGLGCLAGTAGMARVNDYLRAFPGHVAVLLSVELCSLTLQRDDTSIPALIGVSLFGDGAAAVVATGADRAPVGLNAYRGPDSLASRSLLLPATADMMGWDVSSNGLGLVLSKDVPKMVDDYLGEEVDRDGRSTSRCPRCPAKYRVVNRSRRQGVRSRSLPRDRGHAWAALGCLHRRSLGPAPAVHPSAGLADGGDRVVQYRVCWWCIAALGKYWNTRIIVIPDAPLVRRGTYRWLNHPNYAAVTAQVTALPLVHTAWLTAIVFTIANALVLNVRIRDENAALGYASP